jgi:hypothetical protein
VPAADVTAEVLEAFQVDMDSTLLDTLLQLWHRDVPFAEKSLESRIGLCHCLPLQLVNILDGRTTVNGLTGMTLKWLAPDTLCGVPSAPP